MPDRKNVLLVEDSPELSATLRSALEPMGLEVWAVPTARAAIDGLAARRPDLVCLDLVLPESSGYEVCEYIRSRPELSKLPVVVMSERTLPSDRAFASEAGASAFLAKPFGVRELREVVSNLLQAATKVALSR
jgi:two-component system chemotaxis response regulator CheY